MHGICREDECLSRNQVKRVRGKNSKDFTPGRRPIPRGSRATPHWSSALEGELHAKRIPVREHRGAPPSRVDDLHAGLTGMLTPLPEPAAAGDAKCKGTVRAIWARSPRRGSEFEQDLALKVDELNSAPNDERDGGLSAPELAQRALDRELNGAPVTSRDLPVNDLTSMVMKKKKKPAPAPVAEKRKTEGEEAEPDGTDKKARLEDSNLLRNDALIVEGSFIYTLSLVLPSPFSERQFSRGMSVMRVVTFVHISKAWITRTSAMGVRADSWPPLSLRAETLDKGWREILRGCLKFSGMALVLSAKSESTTAALNCSPL
ncbi:hypothetical protein EI94DRAFT_1790573 [Lactarius quietus]|nr:hypothetical protein EI94DRAFT_1790573 [Lactarius quietus]